MAFGGVELCIIYPPVTEAHGVLERMKKEPDREWRRRLERSEGVWTGSSWEEIDGHGNGEKEEG